MVKARELGFRFDPQDHELIKFLECKAKGKPLPVEGVILEADLYGEKEPWEIFQELGGKKTKSRYFFTRLKKKKELGRQYFRRVGLCGGTWNGETGGKPIYGGGNREKAIGVRKSFSYLNKSLKEEEGGGGDGQVDRRYKWLMTEFTLSADSLKDPSLKHLDYAVCRIRKKDKFKKGRNDEDDSGSDSDYNVVDDGGGPGGGGDDGEVVDIFKQILDDYYKSSLGKAEIGNEDPVLNTSNNVQKSSVKQEEIRNEESLLYTNPFQVANKIDQKSSLGQAETGNEDPLLYTTNPFHVTNNDDQKSGLVRVEIGNEEPPLLYTDPFQVTDNIDQKSGLAQVEIGKEEPLLYTTNPFHVPNNNDLWGWLEQVEIGSEDDSVLYTNPFMMINNWNSNVSENYPTIWTKL